ncbi:MAG: DUF1836 domain-containing protein [Erysipelotrichaceae bacterium]|nr:DUF1836 domain-containing protein [Erysipelotrichaceae bacterium]MDD3924285.1 DUF1836 domain-containing protein [Erysipelotrichaceae bacterium]MDD4643032.1 DUF1836 domain-containing protein [Erysipelotrichaceae bacterium]
MNNKDSINQNYYRLPRLDQITDVGLYLEQTAKFINRYLIQFDQAELTTSMISNYVKLKLLPNPHKKQYSNIHIAILLFISLSKSVLSLDDIRFLLSFYKSDNDFITFYDDFCEKLEQTIHDIFNDGIVNLNTKEEDKLVDSLVLTIAQKIYLDKYIHLKRHS